MSSLTPVFNIVGEEVDKINLHPIFKFPIREDLISRLFFYQFTHRLQPKGRYRYAGREMSAEYFGVGLGIARVPRYKNPPLRGVGAMVAMARGGRKPHAPTSEKNIYKDINKKELKIAIASAISATGNPGVVKKRGHIIDSVPHIPLIVSEELSSVSTASEAKEVLKNLGLWDDILRVKKNKKIVGGKASWRGRRKKLGVGPLIVYLKDEGIVRAVRNFPGVDVVNVNDVTLYHLAPGGVPGRLTVWVRDTFEVLDRRFGKLLLKIS